MKEQQFKKGDRFRTVGGKHSLVFRPSDEERPGVIKRGDDILGQPFLDLPNIPAHKVMATIEGQKIRAADLEMIFNDALTVDYIYNPCGHGYAVHAEPLALAALEIAERLYMADDELKRLVIRLRSKCCMECGSTLADRSHAVNCTAGYKRQMERAAQR